MERGTDTQNRDEMKRAKIRMTRRGRKFVRKYQQLPRLNCPIIQLIKQRHIRHRATEVKTGKRIKEKKSLAMFLDAQKNEALRGTLLE